MMPRRLVVLGHPIGHSLSPAFQNAALRAAGYDLSFEALDVPPSQLERMVEALRLEAAAGSVTIPHKESLVRLCADVSRLARRVGAVNAFRTNAAGQIEGHNTDVAGFDAMAGSLGVRRPDAIVGCFGAGGAAAAVCAAVERWPGATVRVHARGHDRAVALVSRFGPAVRLATSEAELLDGCTVVVNATPVGLGGGEFPIAISALPRDADVMDLVYRPGETNWVQEARRHGHRAADGREMLLHQGAAAFEFWFGHPPELNRMRSALEAATRA